MARLLTNYSGQVSGKFIDMVYVRYKGGMYVRKAPMVRKEARTPAMLRNQQRFAAMHHFCAGLKHTLIYIIWNDRATTGSGYNLFMKSNSPAFAKDGSLLDPLLLKLSMGDLPFPEGLTVERTAPGTDTIRVSWQKESHIGGSMFNDDLMAISYDGDQFSSMFITGIKRKDLGGTFDLPVNALRAEYFYLFFAAEDRRSFSNSISFKI